MALAISVLVTRTDVRPFFWLVLGWCIATTVAEFLVTTRRPLMLRPNVLLARDAGAILTLVGFAGGVDNLVGRMLVVSFLVMLAFAVPPRQVTVVAAGLIGALSALGAFSDVAYPSTVIICEAVWMAGLAVILSALIARRDRDLGELLSTRARLLADAAQAEQRERDRLAEALHDDALQRVLSAGQDIEDGIGSGEREQFVHARETLHEAVKSLRSLTKAMHGERLADAGLVTAVDRIVDDASRRGRLSSTIHVDPDASGDHDALLLSFLRELVGNVVKHANASRVSVSIELSGDDVLLEVIDDGRGMSAADLDRARAGGHLGHATLRDRVEALGGRIEIISAADEGTRVRMVLGENRLRAHRALEQQLDRQREHVAALLAALQEGFVVIRDGQIIEANERFAVLTGFSREALLHLPAGSVPFWPAEGSDTFTRLLEQADSDNAVQCELTLLGADGSRTPVLVSAQVARDRRGRLIGTMVTFRDVSEVVRQFEFSDAMVRAFPGGLVVTDDRGILHVNERFCELIGYRQDELIGMVRPFPFIAAALDDYAEDMRELAAAGDLGGDIVLVHKNGRRVDVLGASAMLRGPDGRWIGQLMAVRERTLGVTRSGVFDRGYEEELADVD